LPQFPPVGLPGTRLPINVPNVMPPSNSYVPINQLPSPVAVQQTGSGQKI
jgi:hypothetical protein